MPISLGVEIQCNGFCKTNMFMLLRVCSTKLHQTQVIEPNPIPISSVCCHMSHLWDMPTFGTGAQEHIRPYGAVFFFFAEFPFAPRFMWLSAFRSRSWPDGVLPCFANVATCYNMFWRTFCTCEGST